MVVYTVFAHAIQSHLDDGGNLASYACATFLLLSDGSVIFVPVCFSGAQETMKYILILKWWQFKSGNYMVAWLQVLLYKKLIRMKTWQRLTKARIGPCVETAMELYIYVSTHGPIRALVSRCHVFMRINFYTTVLATRRPCNSRS